MTIEQIIREAKSMTPRARELALFSLLGRIAFFPSNWAPRVLAELERALADGRTLEESK